MHVPGKNLEKVAKCRLMVCFQDFSGFRHLIQKGIDMNRASKSPASCLHPSPYWSKILRHQFCGRFFHPKKKSYHIIIAEDIDILLIYYPYVSYKDKWYSMVVAPPCSLGSLRSSTTSPTSDRMGWKTVPFGPRETMKSWDFTWFQQEFMGFIADL